MQVKVYDEKIYLVSSDFEVVRYILVFDPIDLPAFLGAGLWSQVFSAK